MKKLLPVALICLLTVPLFWGCEKKGDPPVVPPVESLKIDFSEFTTVGRKSVNTGTDLKGTAGAENVNWGIGALVAGTWNTLITLNTIIPVAAFDLAIDNDPVYIDKKTWQWEYTFEVVGATYKARLVGKVREDDVLWYMYISKSGVGAYDEFLWFSGATALDGNSGYWILMHSQQFQEPLINIAWEKTGDQIGSISYTYVRELTDDRSMNPYKGSTIEYGLTTNTLNAYYDAHYYNLSTHAFTNVNIEWSTTVHNGRVKAPDFFQDSNWHCWDSNGLDVTCN
ncbi:MAG: hypothetical protein U0X39_14880 [Bacteroidales bacterium]